MDTCVQRFIRIECPGVVEDDIDWEEMPNGVKISPSEAVPGVRVANVEVKTKKDLLVTSKHR